MEESIEGQAQTWCQAIPGASFCGEPSRYEDDYETMLTEIGKLESIHGADCDWKEVYRCADLLTREKTKDMTVLGALAIAALQQRGLAGLAAALRAYRWLVENHSKTMLPKAARRRGRAGAYTWLTQQLEAQLASVTPNAESREALETCNREFVELDRLLREELDELHPRIGPLKERLATLVQQSAPPPPPPPETPPPAEPAPAEPAPAAPAPAAPAQSPAAPPAAAPAQSPAAPPAAAAPAQSPAPPAPAALPPQPLQALPAIASVEEAQQTLETVTSAIRQLALFWLKHDDDCSLGYHFAHVATFLGVAPDGQRMPTALPPKTVATIEGWSSSGAHDPVISSIEVVIEKYGALNLDVERCLARALQTRGADSASAAVAAHAAEVRARMGDAAGASAETLSWLDSMMAATPATAGTDPANDRAKEPDSTAEDQDAVARAIEEATQLAKRENLEAGCGLLHAELDRSGTKPERFRLRLGLARLCVEHEAADLARPLLQDLYQELQEPIGEWERTLLVEVATATLACDRQLARHAREPVPELEEEARKMMTLLARVDPQTAFRERQKRR